MRFLELLNEYNQAATVKNLGDKMVYRYKADRDTQFDKNDPELGLKLVEFMEAIDPTKKKAFTKFLCQWYARGSMRQLEDAAKAIEPIELYAKFKNRLQGVNLDQMTFDKFLDLGDELKDIKSGKDQDKEEELVFYNSGDAELFYNDAELKITIPKTKEASQYFGRNTRWCTAATKGQNLFSSYASTGDIYIILFKKTNVRWQFHFESGSFMDEKDQPLVPDLVRGNNKLQKIFESNFSKIILKMSTSKANMYYADHEDDADEDDPSNCLRYMDTSTLSLEQIVQTINATLVLVKQEKDKLFALDDKEKHRLSLKYPQLLLLYPDFTNNRGDYSNALRELGCRSLHHSEDLKVTSVPSMNLLKFFSENLSMVVRGDDIGIAYVIEWADNRKWLLYFAEGGAFCMGENARNVDGDQAKDFRDNQALQDLFSDKILDTYHAAKEKGIAYRITTTLSLLNPAKLTFKEALESGAWSNIATDAYAAGFQRLTDEQLIGILSKMPWVFSRLPDDQVSRVPNKTAFECFEAATTLKGFSLESEAAKRILSHTPDLSFEQTKKILDDDGNDTIFTYIKNPSPEVQRLAASKFRHSVTVDELNLKQLRPWEQKALDFFTDPEAIKTLCQNHYLRIYYTEKGLFKPD